MKRSVISIALIMMLALSCCFVSCEKGDTSDSTSDTQSQSQAETTSDVSLESSEEIKNGVFVEEIGNERITREYRDGENDYTVTIRDKNGNDVTDEYHIKQQYGLLEVTKPESLRERIKVSLQTGINSYK